MFVKTAKVPIIAIAEAEFDSSTNKIAFKRSASEKHASYYQDNAGRINIQAMLDLVAEDYNISKNPRDYIFEAVRAVTAEVPNENGDAFPREELLRFDHRLGKAIYQTFIGKPHHINHRADNPKASRGVVIDASYNDIAPALESCPSCNHRTAEAEGRDKSGLNCIKCGSTVKDEFVELLLAVDTKKDPTFAEGVRAGSLDSLSMGCEAGYTDCSICENRARTTSQFCQHIKSGNKKKQFKTASGMKMSFEKCGEVVFTEISRVDQPADPTAKQREILEFTKLPMNIESEMLVMASKIAKLESMVKAAQVAPTGADAGLVEVASPQVPFKNLAESIKWAENSVHKLKAEVHRLVAEKDRKHKEASDAGRPFYAWENATYDAQIKANRQYIARLEDYVSKAREMQASGTPWEKGLTRQMSRFFASKEGQALDSIRDDAEKLKVMHPEMAPVLDQLLEGGEGDHAIPEPMSIDDYAKKHEESFDQNVTPGEMGMKLDETGGLPTTMASKIIEDKIASDLDALVDSVKENNVSADAKAFKFANSYQNLEATVTKSGNVKVHTSAGTLFVVRPEPKPADEAAAQKIAAEVLTHIAENGIVDTVLKYNTVIGPKMGQVLEHHMEDFDGGREEGDKKGMPEDGDDDLADKRSKPEKSMVKEEHTDRKDMKREKRDQGNADVLEKHQPDHAEALPAGFKPAADGGEDDGPNAERGKPAKSTLKDIAVDFKDKQPKSAQMMAPPGAPPAPATGAGPVMAAPGEPCACQPGMCACPPDCMKCNEMEKCGCPCGSKMAQDMAPAAPPAAAPAPSAPASGMPMAASADEALVKEAAKKHVTRVERLYKARLDKVSADAAEKVAAADKAAEQRVAAKMLRALKLAAKRQALNLEFSPVKDAMFDVLTAELDLDADSFYPGMDEGTAAHLVEAATAGSIDVLVDSLVKRASEFMNMNDEAFTALEGDVQNLRPAPISVTASARSKVAAREDVRKAATDGNFVVAPTTSDETISNTGNRDNIRSALGSTKVRRTSQALLKR